MELSIKMFDLISPCLIIIGWLVVRANATLFAKRSEMNSIAKDITVLLDKIIDESQQYFLNNSKVQQVFETLSLSILQRIITKKSALGVYNLNINDSLITELRQSLSLGSKSDDVNQNYVSLTNVVVATNAINIHIDEQLVKRNNLNLNSIIFTFPNQTGIILGLIILFLYFSLLHLIQLLN